MIEGAFVVVDEEARRPEPFRSAFLDLIELDGRGNGVRRAAMEAALPIGWWEMLAQVDAPG